MYYRQYPSTERKMDILEKKYKDLERIVKILVESAPEDIKSSINLLLELDKEE